MNRYKFLLKPVTSNTLTIGLFPWGTVIDTTSSNIKEEKIYFFDAGMEFISQLANKQISVVLFINQFKLHPLPMNQLEQFSNAVAGTFRSNGVNVIGPYWCPGTDKKDIYVVPNPGMFSRVTENTGFKWKDIPVLSANDVDLLAAKNASAKPIKIGESHKTFQSYATLEEWLRS